MNNEEMRIGTKRGLVFTGFSGHIQPNRTTFEILRGGCRFHVSFQYLPVGPGLRCCCALGVIELDVVVRSSVTLNCHITFLTLGFLQFV